MRLTALACLTALLASPAPEARADEPAPLATRDPEDILGDLVVAARARDPRTLVLPKIGVEPLAEDEDSRELLAILRRDLDLSFELEVLPTPPVAPTAAGPAAALARWRGAGAEYLAQVGAKTTPGGQVELSVVLYALRHGDNPVLRRTFVSADALRRVASHRLSDAILGVITGYAGPFASQLTFVRTDQGKGKRQVHVIDADGDGLAARSPPDQFALSPAFGPGHTLYYLASVNYGRYRVYREGIPEPLGVPIYESMYGLAFTDDRTRVAVSIAVDGDVRMFVGNADFSGLVGRSDLPLALHPAFSADGALAFAGTARKLQRIYIDDRAVSAPGLSSAAPTFCRHPDGTRIVYGVTIGAREDLITTDDRGGDTIRLTAGKGRSAYPACSPDGRLVAYFTTAGPAGPGLYLTRVDGLRPPKKIADTLGDSLRWARLP